VTRHSWGKEIINTKPKTSLREDYKEETTITGNCSPCRFPTRKKGTIQKWITKQRAGQWKLSLAAKKGEEGAISSKKRATTLNPED